MAEVHHLGSQRLEAFADIDKADLTALATGMDRIAGAAIEAGGYCDEAAFMAAVFGTAAIDGEVDIESVVRRQDRNSLKKINDITLALGEPYAYLQPQSPLVDTRSVGVLTPALESDKLLSYRITPAPGGIIGQVLAHGLEYVSDVGIVRQVVPVGSFARQQRRSVTNANVRDFQPIDKLVIGMRPIRANILNDAEHEPNALSSIDQKVAAIRRFAGTALVSPLRYN